MSLQLRELVIKSLKDLVSFFMIHKVWRRVHSQPSGGKTAWLELTYILSREPGQKVKF